MGRATAGKVHCGEGAPRVRLGPGDARLVNPIPSLASVGNYMGHHEFRVWRTSVTPASIRDRSPGFYGTSKNMLVTLDRGQPNGGFAFLPISTDTRTVGTEIEGAVTPLAGLQLRAVATVQDPRFTRFHYDFFVPGNNALSGAQTRDYAGNRLNDVASVLGDVGASYGWRSAEIFGDYRYSGGRPANRPNTVTIPAFGELNGGVGYRLRQAHVRLQGLNLLNTQAIQQMAQRTGEDILRVNADGTAVSLVTSGANAGTTTTSRFTTGLGIMPRTLQLSLTYDF